MSSESEIFNVSSDEKRARGIALSWITLMLRVCRILWFLIANRAGLSRSIRMKDHHSLPDEDAALLLCGSITRREFVKRSLAAGVGIAVIADICAPYSTAFANGPELDLLERIKQEGGELFVHNWDDYIHPDTIPTFEREFGVKVRYSTFPGNEQLLAELGSGEQTYDVVFPSHHYVPVMIAQNLLAPVNRDHIPNLRKIIPKFLNTGFDPGNQYSVPYCWGMTALAYNTRLVGKDPNLGSWALMFESGSKSYSGKLGFTDEREEVIAAALIYLGYSANTQNISEIREAGKLLTGLKPHVRGFYTGDDEKTAFINEELAVGHSWNGDIVTAHWKNPTIRWNLPKEGGTGWFDTMVIPRNAPHKFTAEAFINYMHRPEVAADISNVTGYATSNGAAVDTYVFRKIAKNPAIYPTEKELQRIEFLGTVTDSVRPVYDEIWQRLTGS